MNGERTFKTHLIWHDSRGGECDCEARVTYVGRKGYADTMEEPGEPASVEIIRVVDNYGDDLPDHFLTDDDLMAECFEDWAADEEAAAEWREQSRRDQMMGGF